MVKRICLLDLMITIYINNIDMEIIRYSAKGWNKYASYSELKTENIHSWQIDSTPGWFCENLIEENTYIDWSRGFKLSCFNIVEKHNNKVAIYNTASESIILLENKEYEDLEKWIVNPRIEISQYFLSNLFTLGIIVYLEEDEMFKVDYIINSSIYNSSNIKSFVIYPTTECNARCFYCFAHEDICNGLKMSYETAADLIEFICKQVGPNDEVVFRWFGGEPLVATDVIDYIISNFRERMPNNCYHSIITTNASLLTPELLIHAIKEWNLKKLLLPIDGYRNTHDKRKNYRGNDCISYYSALRLIIEQALSLGVYCVIRFNIDRVNINELDEVLMDFKEFNTRSNFFFQATTLHVPEFMIGKNTDRFFTYNDFEGFYGLVFDKMLEYSYYKSIPEIFPKRQLSVCEAKLSNHFLISSDGNIYACEQENHTASSSLGNCKTGVITNIQLEKWINTKLADSCKECRFVPVCLGGCEYYRQRNDEFVTPCTRAKFYIGILLKKLCEYPTSKNM